MKVSSVAVSFISAFMTPTLYACRDALTGEPGCTNPMLDACIPSSLSPPTRKLSEKGVVVHFDPKTMTIPRSEVVLALDVALNGGQDNFELQETYGNELLVLDITRDGMGISMPDGGTSAAFNIQNTFVVRQPGVKYHVNCPPEASGNACLVKKMGHGEEEEANCVLGHFDENIKIDAKCNDQLYGVSLYYTEGPHFFLGASHADDVGDDCPAFIAFASFGGKKMKAALKDTQLFLNKDVPVHHLGDALLEEILKAENAAEALDTTSYDLATNNCVHYAVGISRPLEFAETTELATFIIENTVNDGNFEAMAKENDYSGGLRYLAAKAIGGTDMMEDFVEDMVYSQLNIN